MSAERTTFVYRRGTTSLPNSTIGDKRLSHAALGLLLDILARPESASQGYRAYLGRGLGQDGILNAFKAMAEAGYRHQILGHAADGRVITFTVVAEEPIDHEVAKEWLHEQLRKQLADNRRALPYRARRDLRKRAKDGHPEPIEPGDTVHANTVHGPPVPGSPVHGQPVPGPTVRGEGMHKPSVSKGLSSLRSQDPEEIPDDQHAKPGSETRIPADFRARKASNG